MARYIDLDKYDNFECGMEYCDGQLCIDCYYEHGGAEDVVPVVHARWESKLADNGWKDVSCSNCKHTINVDVHCSVDYEYCPYCGAKMRGEK